MQLSSVYLLLLECIRALVITVLCAVIDETV